MAVRTCLRAAEAHPYDPVPWVSLLTLARLYPGGHRQFNHWWKELKLRHRDNREAHNQALRHVSARWHGTHGTMYDFARDVVDSNSPGSPLAVLLQVARLEEYRYRLEREGDMALFLRRHWSTDVALADTRRTWDTWVVNWDGIYRAQDIADFNYLLHATCAAWAIQRSRLPLQATRRPSNRSALVLFRRPRDRHRKVAPHCHALNLIIDPQL